ncbi:MAG TPA: hypothetical protein VMB71_08970 [Acetobacteraceae bacterium]|nr:hypothetical protein [Acetobacteraceae bacterium]
MDWQGRWRDVVAAAGFPPHAGYQGGAPYSGGHFAADVQMWVCGNVGEAE